MSTRKIYDNSSLFVIYGWVNIFLVLMLLTLLVLLFNEIQILTRTGFIIFIGIHIAFVFILKVHYLSIIHYPEKNSIEFHYNRTFGIRWLQKSSTVVLPIKQFYGYEVSRDSLGMTQLSFYKLENREKFELGPFHVLFLTSQERHLLENTFGESL